MSQMLGMPQIVALLLLMAILFMGDLISIKTKAWIPSVFVCAVLFLIGYWTFFPSDIVARAGIGGTVATLLMYFLITNMGTLLSIRELTRQWKTVVITLSGIVGIIIFSFTIGYWLFDWNTVIVAIPPLVGGIIAAVLMSKGAETAGLGDDLIVFAIVLYVMQGFIGYPLTSIMLKKEGRKVLTLFRQGKWKDEIIETTSSASKETKEHVDVLAVEEKMPRMFKAFPAQYNTVYFQFLRISVVGLAAYLVSVTLAPIITLNVFVLCLLFGVIATSIGFLEKQVLQKANGFGFAMMGLMLFIFDSLNRATPDMLIRLLTPLVVLIIAAVIGMYIFSMVAGKILGVSREMAFAISLTAFYGFPADYIITNEVINSLTRDEKERQILNRHMLAPMLIGGFVSVTIVSLVLAGIFVNLLEPILK